MDTPEGCPLGTVLAPTSLNARLPFSSVYRTAPTWAFPLRPYTHPLVQSTSGS